MERENLPGGGDVPRGICTRVEMTGGGMSGGGECPGGGNDGGGGIYQG